jgi:polar amino acid transport system substrate-binding protein
MYYKLFKNTIFLTIFCILFSNSSLVTNSQEIEKTSIQNQVVSAKLGVRKLEPFIIKEDTSYTGFSMEIWKEISKKSNIETTEIKEYNNVGEMINGVKNNEVDTAISAISITSDRLEIVDFSQPMLNSGLKIMVPVNQNKKINDDGIFTQMITAFRTKEFFWLVLLTFLISLIPSHILYFIEGYRKKGMFSENYFVGITQAIGWTITTLGQGISDVPNTKTGKFLSIVWMFIGIIFISFFTATITTDLTAKRLEPSIQGISDLPGKKVLSVKNSTASKFLNSKGIEHETTDDIQTALTKVANKEVDALVFDAPALEYYETHKGKSLVTTVGEMFKPEGYGIAVSKNNNELLNRVNKSLLEMKEDGSFDEIYKKWFGN